MPQMPKKALLITSKVARLFGQTSRTGLTTNPSPIICERVKRRTSCDRCKGSLTESLTRKLRDWGAISWSAVFFCERCV